MSFDRSELVINCARGNLHITEQVVLMLWLIGVYVCVYSTECAWIYTVTMTCLM